MSWRKEMARIYVAGALKELAGLPGGNAPLRGVNGVPSVNGKLRVL